MHHLKSCSPASFFADRYMSLSMYQNTQASAQLHRKLSLVHRSWTPHVLRSLYHTPRLTSRRSIEFFLWCLTHPQELWGYDGCPVIVPQDEEWDEVLEEVAKVEGSDGVLGVGGEGNTGASASAGPLSSINGNGCSNLMAASMLSGGSKRGGGFNNLQRRNANGNGNGPRTMTEQMLMNAGMLNAMTAMGNLVPDRRRLVKYICFNVGTGVSISTSFFSFSFLECLFLIVSVSLLSLMNPSPFLLFNSETLERTICFILEIGSQGLG